MTNNKENKKIIAKENIKLLNYIAKNFNLNFDEKIKNLIFRLKNSLRLFF